MTDEIVIVDISEYNGVVDWNVMKTKAQGVIIRYGKGNDTRDAMVSENVAGARSVGMVYGGYWAAKAGRDWRKHIASFTAAYNEFGGDLPPSWDCEVTEYTRKWDTTNWLSKLIPNSEATLPKKPMVYTRATWWDYHTYRTDWPKQYDIWTAHYTTAPEGTIVLGKPVPWIPDDWGAVANPRTWTFWQYTADGNMKGAEFGTQGESIDINRFNGTIPQFNAKYGTNIRPLTETPPIPPTPLPMPHYVRVKANGTNIRNSPVIAPVSDIGSLDQGAVLEVTAEQPDWYTIKAFVAKSVVTVVS